MHKSKYKIFFVTLILITSVQYSSARRCTGSDNCGACKTCNYCEYCNSGDGSCGVCGNSNNENEKRNDNDNGIGIEKYALVGGGTYLLYRALKKKE